ncbi:helix-turn-helix transcriptional regulator [Pseudobacter ginsenosidimutans]|nr:helix-turn-helix transcriptional regulator [Pseudobacter ginsenosidimutans]
MPMEKNKIRRSTEIATRYFDFLDQHIDDVVNGDVSDFFELNRIARELTISHKHLTDIIKTEKGHHPCHFYDAKIISKAQELLTTSDLSIAQIAMKLTYDPSNFSKFFKKWTGFTPGEYRNEKQK